MLKFLWAYIPLSLLVLVFQIQAQDTLEIRGRVIDGYTHEPIPFAYIKVIEPYAITQGDINGYFQLESIGDFREFKSVAINVHLTGYPDFDTLINHRNFFIGTSKKILEFEAVLITLDIPMPIIPQPISFYPVRHFVPSQYSIHDSIRGNLNLDGREDLILILNDESDKSGQLSNRPMLLLQGNGKGFYSLLGRNDKIISCRECGGAMGDPYQGIEIINGTFAIHQLAGSAWRTSWHITFKYDRIDWKFKLSNFISYSFHSTEFDKSEEKVNPELHGIAFDEFSYEEKND